MLKLAAGRLPTEPDEPERDRYDTFPRHYATAAEETMRSVGRDDLDRSLERAPFATGGAASAIPRKSGILKNAPQQRRRESRGGARSLSERKRDPREDDYPEDLRNMTLTADDYKRQEERKKARRGNYQITVPQPFSFDKEKVRSKSIRELKLE